MTRVDISDGPLSKWMEGGALAASREIAENDPANVEGAAWTVLMSIADSLRPRLHEYLHPLLSRDGEARIETESLIILAHVEAWPRAIVASCFGAVELHLSIDLDAPDRPPVPVALDGPPFAAAEMMILMREVLESRLS